MTDYFELAKDIVAPDKVTLIQLELKKQAERITELERIINGLRTLIDEIK